MSTEELIFSLTKENRELKIHGGYMAQALEMTLSRIKSLYREYPHFISENDPWVETVFMSHHNYKMKFDHSYQWKVLKRKEAQKDYIEKKLKDITEF